MEIETYLPTKSMVSILHVLTSFPNFSKCHKLNSLKQSLILTSTILETLRLNTLDCYGDFKDLCKY